MAGSDGIWFLDSGGPGFPVVLLHAASGSSASWAGMLERLAAAGWRVIAPDRRGFGRSAAGPGSASDDLEDLAARLRLTRFHLVATAAGGIVALDYAAEHPERVARLVVANTMGGVDDPGYRELQERLGLDALEDLPVALRELGPSYRARDPVGTRRFTELAGGPRGSSQAPRVPMTLARLGTLRVPTLFLAGDADLLSPPPLMAVLAGAVPGAELKTFAGIGHALFWEDPDAFFAAVDGFLHQPCGSSPIAPRSW